MPTYSADVLPSVTGINLGSAALRWDIYLQDLDITGTLTLGSSGISTSGAIVSTGSSVTGLTLVSTVAGGTAPITVTSSTKCTNLNADFLDGVDWSAPGTIGGSTPGAANFTTISATGAITSTLVTGTAPFVIASTTQVSNLNVSQLVGATWVGPGTIGSTTPSTGAFTTLAAGSAKFTINASGLLTKYNNIATVAGGVPSELAAVDLTGQTAAVGTTTLYAVVAAGQYRLSWNAKVTTVASTGAATSTLGALTIVYTDPDSVAQTITAAAVITAGTIATTSTGNLTSTKLVGVPQLLNCKAGTNITYAMAYASDTANQMAYNLHLVLEAL